MTVLRVLRSLAAAALVVSTSAIAAPSALATSEDAADPGATSGTTWAVEPSDEEGPDGRVSLRHDVEGGATVSDFVVVTNFGERPATFAIYASDGVVTADGNFDLLPADTAPVDGGAWVEIGEVDGATPRDGGGIVLEAPASSSTVIPVDITVPANATPGDHPAGVVAERVQGDDTAVQMSSRVGVRLHLRVPGEIVAQVQPQEVTATYSPSWNPFAPGTVTLEYSLSNVGNIRVGANVAASVAGPFGLGGGETSTEHREILPGQSTADTGQFEAWPLFLGRGEVTAAPVGVGEDEVPAELMASSAAFTVWMVPWSQLVLLALLIAAPLLVIKARKRSSARIQARIDAAVAAAAAPAADDAAMPGEPAAEAPEPTDPR